jgi:hypothetical protein
VTSSLSSVSLTDVEDDALDDADELDDADDDDEDEDDDDELDDDVAIEVLVVVVGAVVVVVGGRVVVVVVATSSSWIVTVASDPSDQCGGRVQPCGSLRWSAKVSSGSVAVSSVVVTVRLFESSPLPNETRVLTGAKSPAPADPATVLTTTDESAASLSRVTVTVTDPPSATDDGAAETSNRWQLASAGDADRTRSPDATPATATSPRHLAMARF